MRRSLAAVGLALAAWVSPALAGEPGVEEVTLDNGLPVLLRPVPGAPKTALVVVYGIGGRDDPDDAVGLAHLLEHLYVTAAAGSEPARTTEQLVARYKDGWQAQTGWDYTVVATVFPSDRLEPELRDAAARMGDLKIEPADLEREIPRVVAELANMYEGVPQLAALNHSANDALGRANRPHGGDAGAVQRVKVDRARERWKRFYKPRNAIVALAGGFAPAAAKAALGKTFGTIPAGELLTPPPEPPASTTTREVRRVPVPGRETWVAVSIPASAFALPALLVYTSRLYDAAPSLGAGRAPVAFAPLDRSDVLTVAIQPSKDETPDAAMRRLESFLVRRTEGPITPTERGATIERYKNFLGLSDGERLGRSQPYLLAFGLARRRQLGWKPEVVEAGILTLDANALGSIRLPMSRLILTPE